jgi:hypothetical protein
VSCIEQHATGRHRVPTTADRLSSACDRFSRLLADGACCLDRIKWFDWIDDGKFVGHERSSRDFGEGADPLAKGGALSKAAYQSVRVGLECPAQSTAR